MFLASSCWGVGLSSSFPAGSRWGASLVFLDTSFLRVCPFQPDLFLIRITGSCPARNAFSQDLLLHGLYCPTWAGHAQTSHSSWRSGVWPWIWFLCPDVQTKISLPYQFLLYWLDRCLHVCQSHFPGVSAVVHSFLSTVFFLLFDDLQP